MRRKIRSAVVGVLAALIAMSGALIAPDTVLCLGPGNHCHFETVLGASCDRPAPASESSMPRPLDGCPRGSRDLRVSIDTHRTDNTPRAAAFAPSLTSPAAAVASPLLSDRILLPVQTARATFPAHSTIILRC